MKLWLPGAERISGPHSAGLPMTGGKGRFCTHHITVTGKGSYEGAKHALLSEGYEPTLLVDAVAGKIGQFFPANRAGYALEHPSGTPVTNTEGIVHVQIEWVWPAMWSRLQPWRDITRAPHFDDCWLRVVEFTRQLGIPDVWPYGFHSTSRDEQLWETSGHRGHINAPHNSHVDNLPAAKQPPWPGLSHPLTEAHRSEVGDLAGTFTARARAKQAFVATDRADVQHLIAAAQAALNVKES